MSTATDSGSSNTIGGSSSAFEEGRQMKRCQRCNLTYLPSKSSSALRLTYCSFFCELGDLGFSMDSLERITRAPEEAPSDSATDAEADDSAPNDTAPASSPTES